MNPTNSKQDGLWDFHETAKQGQQEQRGLQQERRVKPPPLCRRPTIVHQNLEAERIPLQAELVSSEYSDSSRISRGIYPLREEDRARDPFRSLILRASFHSNDSAEGRILQDRPLNSQFGEDTSVGYTSSEPSNFLLARLRATSASAA